MNAERQEPTKAQMLATLVTGNGTMGSMGTAVQRSHRFPLHIFIQIENLARMADTSVSVIINQLLDCGLEAVRNELPEEVAEQLSIVTKEQTERPTKPFREEVKKRNPVTGRRRQGAK